jgi:hypothetical protein
MISGEPAPMLEDKEKWYIIPYHFNKYNVEYYIIFVRVIS